MFKITKTDDPADSGMQVQNFVEPDRELVSHYCLMEGWTASLATGVFRIGPGARHHHGLPDEGDFGLLNLVQCYDSRDRQHVLEIYEMAAMTPSSFCFSTTIIHGEDIHAPVMCIGESSNFSDDEGGAINGVFIFPKFKLNQAAPFRSQ